MIAMMVSRIMNAVKVSFQSTLQLWLLVVIFSESVRLLLSTTRVDAAIRRWQWGDNNDKSWWFGGGGTVVIVDVLLFLRR